MQEKNTLTLEKFWLKYAIDKIIVLPLIVLFSPLMLIIALAIKIEGWIDQEARGLVLHKENRISQGEPFVLLKFRLLKSSVLKKFTDQDSATFLAYDRKNVTRVGKVLIQCYFDELPQLFCILMGKMSLVGPRPRIRRVYEKDLMNGNIALKHLRGGLAGLHQSNKGTKEFSINQSDEYYKKCKEYNALQLVMYDFALMLKTFLKMIKAEGL